MIEGGSAPCIHPCNSITDIKIDVPMKIKGGKGNK